MDNIVPVFIRSAILSLLFYFSIRISGCSFVHYPVKLSYCLIPVSHLPADSSIRSVLINRKMLIFYDQPLITGISFSPGLSAADLILEKYWQ